MTTIMTPGAERAARVREAQVRNHANAVAQWDDGEPFAVILRRGPREAMGMVTGYAITCRVPADRVPGIGHRAALVIDGLRYEVSEPPEPDDSGWLVLQLQEALHD